MPTLNGAELKGRLESTDDEKRLVVSPLLEPGEQIKEYEASIDIRLGFEYCFVSPSTYGAIDEFDDMTNSPSPDVKKLYSRRYAPFGRRIMIHPHQFVLAATLEYLRVPPDLMAYVIGRSTWGRLGLIVATAVGVQPGFAGTLTLELRNLGETPLALYPGQSVAQLFFHTVSVSGADQTHVGQYTGATDILPRNLSSPTTHEKLHRLKNRT